MRRFVNRFQARDAFAQRLNQAGPMAKTMAANVYTVYIIHQTVLYALNILLLPINIPAILKFFIVGLIAVPVCFVLSSLHCRAII